MKRSVGVTFSCKQDHDRGWRAGSFTVQHQHAVLARINNSMQEMDDVYASNARSQSLGRFLTMCRTVCTSI